MGFNSYVEQHELKIKKKEKADVEVKFFKQAQKNLEVLVNYRQQVSLENEADLSNKLNENIRTIQSDQNDLEVVRDE